MLELNRIDIYEDSLLKFDKELLSILLLDHSSNDNIIWATDNYADLGADYAPSSHITIEKITGENTSIIQPRVNKSREIQTLRSKDKAEVFTPSWVCNKQNNLVDDAFFGRTGVFNTEIDRGWIPTEIVDFRDGEDWQDYVKAKRMEITCGEAPYITSRYDTTTGDMIEPLSRIGILDRKFRVVHEILGKSPVQTWFKWMKIALQSTYGYEWQGDNLLLARENVLFTFIDFYQLRRPGEMPTIGYLKEVATIISWNLWQMDGLKMVIPETCHDIEHMVPVEKGLFDEDLPDFETKLYPCPGCKDNNIHLHNGIQCKIMNWFPSEPNDKTGEIFFHTLIK